MSATYFHNAQNALRAAGLCEPVLLIDKARLDTNIKALKKMLPRGMAYRIVAKSLPSVPLLTHIARRAKTDRLMSFNAVMVAQLLTSVNSFMLSKTAAPTSSFSSSNRPNAFANRSMALPQSVPSRCITIRAPAQCDSSPVWIYSPSPHCSSL